MAVGADRIRAIGKLLRVTTRAREVILASGHRWLCGVRLASMTQRARQSFVIRGRVLKFRVVSIIPHRHSLIRVRDSAEGAEYESHVSAEGAGYESHVSAEGAGYESQGQARSEASASPLDYRIKRTVKP